MQTLNLITSHRDSCDETVLVWGNTWPFEIEQRLEQPESLNHLVQLDPQIYPGQLTSLEHNSQATDSNCRGRIHSPSRSPGSHLIKFGATLAKTKSSPFCTSKQHNPFSLHRSGGHATIAHCSSSKSRNILSHLRGPHRSSH
jgi:hypothetical protein